MEMRRKASVWKEEGEKSTSKSHKHKPVLKAIERATSHFCSQYQQAEGQKGSEWREVVGYTEKVA